jgi:hypothetical protein
MLAIRSSLLCILWVVALAFAPFHSRAQDSSTGSIHGVVLDAAQGLVAQASVVVVNSPRCERKGLRVPAIKPARI